MTLAIPEERLAQLVTPTVTDKQLELVHASLDKLFGARPAQLGGTGINPAFFSENTVVYVPTPAGIAALDAAVTE